MARYDYRCCACGVVTEVERPMAAAEHEGGLVACTCGAFEWRRVYYAPQVIRYGDPTEINPNPIERFKREQDMRIMIPHEQYVREHHHRRRLERTIVREDGT